MTTLRARRRSPATDGGAGTLAAAARTIGGRRAELDFDGARAELARRALHRSPDATSLPPTKMPTPSHTCWTWCSRWLDEQTRRRRHASSRMSSRISSTPAGSMAVVGSSRMMIDGRLDEHIGEAESLLHAARVRLDLSSPASVSPTRPSSSSIASSASARDAVEPGRVAQVLAAGHGPVKADVVGHVAHAALHLDGLRAGSRPSTRAVPAVGSDRPRSIRMVVVLPAPFGPSRPKTWPWRTSDRACRPR